MIRLIRHGSTILAERGVKYGTTDATLSLRGYEECFAVPLDFVVTEIRTSPLRRARDTADILASRMGWPSWLIRTHPELRERSFGEAEGMLVSDVNERWERRTDIPGYETDEEIRARVIPDLSTAPDGALVVTHAGVIRALTGIRANNLEVVTWSATS